MSSNKSNTSKITIITEKTSSSASELTSKYQSKNEPIIRVTHDSVAEIVPQKSISKELVKDNNNNLTVLKVEKNNNSIFKDTQNTCVVEKVTKFGEKQSPINIIKSLTKVDNDLIKKPLILEYSISLEKSELVNTGHGWMVDVPPIIAQKTSLKGGPLAQNYRLRQFHAHWGTQKDNGSEHAIDGCLFATEIHFVHWNVDLYKSAGDACEKEGGLAVIAVIVEVGDNKHEELEKIVKLIDNIKYKDEKVVLNECIYVDKLIPKNKNYFTYKGSLTTPPYSESVTWIVFKEPIKAHASQIAKFRELFSAKKSDCKDGKPLCQNCRPIQPINDRIVYTI